jgi:transcriptional regulator with XRE-family HTH domain
MDMTTQRNSMTADEFRARWAEIKNTYGTSRQTAGARFEQVTSEFLSASGWTQEEIAEEVGYTRQRVAQLLTFGQFLANATAVANANLATLKRPLTEFRFRSFWVQTKDMAGNDRRRYQATWQLILADEQDQAAKSTRRDLAPLREGVLKHFCDGKGHSLDAILNKLDTDQESFEGMLKGAGKQPHFPFDFEKKAYGPSFKYKFFKKDRQLSLHKALEELTPILQGLQAEAAKSMVTISVPTVARLARQLELVIKAWDE